MAFPQTIEPSLAHLEGWSISHLGQLGWRDLAGHLGEDLYTVCEHEWPELPLASGLTSGQVCSLGRDVVGQRRHDCLLL